MAPSYEYAIDPITGRRVKVPAGTAEANKRRKKGRPKLDEAALAELVNINARIPLVAWDAIDLIAQYDRVPRVEVLRWVLWAGIRSRTSADRRLTELLENNGIDVAPTDFVPRRYRPDPNDKPDPSDLL